jgi:hypothetical protein
MLNIPRPTVLWGMALSTDGTICLQNKAICTQGRKFLNIIFWCKHTHPTGLNPEEKFACYSTKNAFFASGCGRLVLAILLWLSCSGYPPLAVLPCIPSQLSCPFCRVRTLLSSLSCPGWLALAGMFQLS